MRPISVCPMRLLITYFKNIIGKLVWPFHGTEKFVSFTTFVSEGPIRLPNNDLLQLF